MTGEQTAPRRTPVIAIDGPAASGKGTLARRLAAHYGYDWLDTGGLYRGVAALVLRAGGDAEDAVAATEAAGRLDRALLADPFLKSAAVAAAASRVAALPPVRAALLDFQRRFAASPPGQRGAVLDGRDIGTVICPAADVKLFITATVEARAHRRHLELRTGGENSIYARVAEDLRERDRRDSSRSAAPLRPAEDAFRLDTSEMNAEAAFAAALSYAESVLGRRTAGSETR